MMSGPYYQSIRIAGTDVTSALVTPNPAVLHILFVEKSNSTPIIVRNGSTLDATVAISVGNLGIGAHQLDIYCPAGIIVEKDAEHDLMVCYEAVFPGL